MKLLPDFTTGTPGRPIQDRLDGALVALCQNLVPIDTPTGLKAVAQSECQRSAELARERFETGDANQKRARIESRAAANRDACTAAARRRETDEADLQTSLAGTDESRITKARVELAKSKATLAALVDEGRMLSRLLADAKAECETEQRRIVRQTEQELLSAMAGRLIAARAMLVGLMQRPEVAEAIGEFALSKFIASLPSVFPGIALASAAQFQEMPADRRDERPRPGDMISGELPRLTAGPPIG